MSKRVGLILVLTSLLAAIAAAQLRVLPTQRSLADVRTTVKFLLPPLLGATATDPPTPSPKPAYPGPTLPACYRYEDLALFCRIEVQLEKAAKLPVRFRLGSVDYVDYLEGKRDGPGVARW